MKGNSSPIAVVIFNRPNYVKTLRNRLDRQQHRTLYLIVDGPRHNRTDDAKLIEESIDHFSDWGGDVFINKSEVNLGCKARVESGLNWVFEQTETAIILEDDLEPSSQFFDFCDQMLETYSNNKNVMSVCGSRLPPKDFNVAEPIYFSKYQNCWGWATWKDSWQLFKDDYSELSSLTLFFNLKNKLGTMRAAMYWVTLYWMVKSGRRSSWAYCWMITCFLNNGLSVYPRSNTIINSGFGEDSTHTNMQEPYMPINYGENMEFPIDTKVIPVISNKLVDQWIEDTMYSKSATNRLSWLLQKFKSDL